MTTQPEPMRVSLDQRPVAGLLSILLVAILPR